MYPDQAFFSKKAVRKPADFKGLKTRVHSVALASLVAGLGGEPLTIPFADTYTALERGTLDAGITGTKPGFGLRWYEVSKYLVGPISMRPHVALSINKNSWRRLPADVQQILKEEAEKIVEGKAFEAIEVWNKEGIDKNVEKGMEHIPFSPETLAAIKDVLRTQGGPGLGEARWRGRGGQELQRGHRAAGRLHGQPLGPADEQRALDADAAPALAQAVDVFSSGRGTLPAPCTSCWPSSSLTTCWRGNGVALSGCRRRGSPMRSAGTCWPWPPRGGFPLPSGPAHTCASTCMFPYLARRVKTAVDVLAQLLMAAFASIVAWKIWILVADSLQSDARSSTYLLTPLYIPQGILGVGFSLLALAAVFTAIAILAGWESSEGSAGPQA